MLFNRLDALVKRGGIVGFLAGTAGGLVGLALLIGGPIATWAVLYHFLGMGWALLGFFTLLFVVGSRLK